MLKKHVYNDWESIGLPNISPQHQTRCKRVYEEVGVVITIAIKYVDAN